MRYYNLAVNLFAILINSIAIWLATKNNHRWVRVVMFANVIIYFFTGREGTILPYIYFIFLFFRWGYRKFTRKKSPSSSESLEKNV